MRTWTPSSCTETLFGIHSSADRSMRTTMRIFLVNLLTLKMEKGKKKRSAVGHKAASTEHRIVSGHVPTVERFASRSHGAYPTVPR